MFSRENLDNIVHPTLVINQLNFDSYMKPDSDLIMGQLRLLETDNPLYLPAETSIRLIVTGMDVIHS
jgi:heme/copper-type cytochrome/quinol oxidase subunit 2